MTKPMSTDEAFGAPPASASDKWFRMKDLDNYVNKKARLRIMSLPAVTGMERWSAPTKDAPAGKPIRWRDGEIEPQMEWKVEPRSGQPQGPKRFWALWVFDHASGKIKAWSF